MGNSKHTKSILFGLTFVMVLLMTNGVVAVFGQSSALDNTLVGAVMKGGNVNQKQVRESYAITSTELF
jgi:glutamate synthase domain-containing protein 3